MRPEKCEVKLLLLENYFQAMQLEECGSVPGLKLPLEGDADRIRSLDEVPNSPNLEDFAEASGCVVPNRQVFSKQCQQMFCIFFYVFSSISLTLYNKWLLSTYDFHFPITMLLFHSFTNAFGAWLLIICFFREKYSELDDWVTNLQWRRYFKLIFPVSLCFCSDLVFTQFGLMVSSVTLSEILKSGIPVLVFVFSVILNHEKFSPFKMNVMGIISIGICLTTLGDEEVEMIGLIFFLIACIAGAAKMIYIENLVGDKHLGLPSLLALAYIASTSVPLLFVASASIEWKRLFASEFINDETQGASTFGFLCIGAVMALMLNLSEILLIGTTSALTACVVGVCKLLIAITIAQMIGYGASLGPVNIAGICITVIGIAGYNYWKMQQRKGDKEPLRNIPYNEVFDDNYQSPRDGKVEMQDSLPTAI